MDKFTTLLDGYSFKEDEKEYLMSLFNKFNKEKVDKFIKSLASICGEKIWFNGLPARGDSKKEATIILKSLYKAHSNIVQLANGYFFKIAHKEQESFPLAGLSSSEQNFSPRARSSLKLLTDVMLDAGSAEKSLRKIIRTLERQVEDWSGRSVVDHDHFVFAIAKAYHENLKKVPTTYWYGSFMKVIKLSQKIVGLPSKAPKRAVEKAVNRLKEQEKKA